MLEKLNVKSGLALRTEIVTWFMDWILSSFQQKLNQLFHLLFRKWEIGYIMMGFLLGRAMILNELSPFGIPFFAVMYHLKREKLLFISLAILLGANLAVHNQAALIFAGMIIFFFTQKWLDTKGKTDLSYTPFLTFVAILLPQVLVHLYDHSSQIYDYFLAGIESVLGFVLTLIFVQAMPIIIYHREQVSLEQEEVIALIILLASVMTGTLGWHVQNFSIEHIASRYFILLFALVGGGSIGSAVGVVTGLILSLSNPNAIYQISLLAFSGLLAGLLKHANKLGVAFGLILGTTILSIYLGNQSEIWISFGESTVAILLLIFTPKTLIKNIAKFIPGTVEFQNHYQEYVAKIRNITSSKIEQYAKMFTQLANSFREISANPKIDETEQLDHFMSQVASKQCQNCFKKNKCWNEEFFKTYKIMTDVMTHIELKGKLAKKDIPVEWVNHCVKYDKTTAELNRIYEEYGNDLYWKNQLEESRQLVAYQLYGVSQVMKDLAEEIKKEGMELSVQEKQIYQSLEQLGLSIRHVNIVNLDEGNVEMEVSQPNCNGRDECAKVIAPLISEVLNENIVVSNKDCQFSSDGTCRMYLRSAKNYEVDTGFAGVAKGGSWLSGDSFSTIEIGNGKFAVALSDGMGNGERAQTESKATLELLQQLLQSGIDETLAIKTINSVLLLRSQEEIFSTVDLAIIDLFNGYTKFLKVGSTPSFIKRGDEVIMVSANNLPVGIMEDIDIDSVGQDLKPGDLLIMMTDGIYDSANHAVNKELWMKRMIQEIETDVPQEFADLLIEKVIRSLQGGIVDDMTVVVSKIDTYKPEWATIKIPGIKRIEREKMIQ
ncbi:stage II sporulation protein E [Tepidibacillus fermentans]|uniref:Stage II sporulation protein E n=1 Tax=Tepidibacillus fermentans TaxID=1281767 RepID=A0A4R3KBY5_9BACI|nr:stage II sporulation protein E [Tepidibacillus fermentans]TCS80151.1 stage II sporulation protein E [Tepidibacillus fermentans]